MPIYLFKCENGHCEEYLLKVGKTPEKCSSCGSKKLWRVYTVPNAIVEQEPKTLGELADRNTKKFGREECLEREMIAEEKLIKADKKKKKSDPPWWRSGKIKGLEKSDKPISGKTLKKYEKIVKEAGCGINKLKKPRKPKQ